MKKTQLKNFSLTGLALMSVSLLTSALIPLKANKPGTPPGNGRQVMSSNGGGVTVVLTAAGSRSHTATGAPADIHDEASATSRNNNDSDTNNCGCPTGFQTTVRSMEEECS